MSIEKHLVLRYRNVHRDYLSQTLAQTLGISKADAEAAFDAETAAIESGDVEVPEELSGTHLTSPAPGPEPVTVPESAPALPDVTETAASVESPPAEAAPEVVAGQVEEHVNPDGASDGSLDAYSNPSDDGPEAT